MIEHLDLPEKAKEVSEYISKRLNFEVEFIFFKISGSVFSGPIYHLALVHIPSKKRIWSKINAITPTESTNSKEIGEDMFKEMMMDFAVHATGYTLTTLPNFKEELDMLRSKEQI